MNYQTCIVTFFDILGFARLVETADRAEDIAGILNDMRAASTPRDENAKLLEMHHVNFSDCTVRAVHIGSAANRATPVGLLWHELRNVLSIQAQLARRGVLLRGCITVGDIFLRDGLIFGPALVRAYKLESEFAIFPRVMIDKRTFEAYDAVPLLQGGRLNEKEEWLRPLLRQGDDGLWFVDYLKAATNDADDAQAADYLLEHRNMILQKAANFKDLDRVSAKFNWLACYHNDVVNEMSEHRLASTGRSRADLLVPTGQMPFLYHL